MKITLHTKHGFSGEYTSSISPTFTDSIDGIMLENDIRDGKAVVNLTIRNEDMYVTGDLTSEDMESLISVLTAFQMKMEYGSSDIHE